MAQIPIQRFEIGDFVYATDGQSGLISQAIFSPAIGGWRYVLAGIPVIYVDADLSLRPEPPVEPERPTDGTLTRAHYDLAVGSGDLSPNIRSYEQFIDSYYNSVFIFNAEFPDLAGLVPSGPAVAPIPPDDEIEGPPERRPGIVTQGLTQDEVLNLIGIHIAEILISSQAARDNLENRIADQLLAVEQTLETAQDNLENRIVTQLSGIEKSLSDQDLAADETGDGGLVGFLARAGGFVVAPYQSLFDVVSQYFVDEVTDGLTK